MKSAFKCLVVIWISTYLFSTGIAQVLQPSTALAKAVFSSLQAKYEDQQITLQAQIRIHLNDTQSDALHSGIPLVFNVEVQVQRERQWWLNEKLGQVHWQKRLSVHQLSKQYVVEDLSSGEKYSFPTIGLALNTLGHINVAALALNRPLENRQKVYGRIKFWLDIPSLPVALQLPAYLSAHEWRLNSGWERWYVP